MIAYLKGEVAAIYEEQIVLEVSGIGYNILMPSSALELIQGIGNEVKVYTHLNVREDAMQLYGFLTKDDLDFFRLLLGVNGVGPKAALSILSTISPDDLRFAVLSGDAKTIGKAQGIGAKTAQRIIIDLKDKVDLEDAFEKKLSHTGAGKEENSAQDRLVSDAVEALTALGYSAADSLRAVKKARGEGGEEEDIEALLKRSLKYISVK
ncbi:MAG: Holliday junction branch migration protein RuvA [Lachnospiraceae bacterium]|nr:Holliday junction branch migration protein RuvA [Lachnospiraceae bacterium]